MATPLHPELLWAQRSSETDAEKNVIYLTINLPDIVESTLKYDVTDTGFKLTAKTGNAEKGLPEKQWATDITFFAPIDASLTKKSLSSRSLSLVLRKKEKQAEYWPRLTKDKVKYSFIKTDFGKWVDEDEQDGAIEVPEPEDPMGGGGGFDPSMMSALGGGGGMPGGMDFEKMMAQMGGGGPPGGFDPSSLGGGPSGAGADSDSDDDDGPPPLESAEEK